MAKSDDLINAAMKKATQKQLEEAQEAESVKATLIAIISENIENWLGEFAAELSTDTGNPGSFEYRPLLRADVNASVEINVTWRGILTVLKASAHNNQLKKGSEGARVELQMIFPDEQIGMCYKYAKKFSLALPSIPSLVATEQKWVFPRFHDKVADHDLAEFLVGVMEVRQWRDKLRQEQAEGRRASERARKYTHHGYAIQHCENDKDLQKTVDMALNDFPGEAEHWNDLQGAVELQIREKKAEHDQYLEDRGLLVEWMQEFKECLQVNQKLLRQIQKQYNYEFQVGKLKYGLVALDEGNTQVLHQYEMYVSLDSVEESRPNYPVTHWMWVQTAVWPHERICVTNPISLEVIRTDVKHAPTPLVCKFWEEHAFEELAAPAIFDPYTYLVELDKTDFEEFPLWSHADICAHVLFEAAWGDALFTVFDDCPLYLKNWLEEMINSVDTQDDDEESEIPF